MRNYYIVINGANNPYRTDTDDFIFMAFRTEEFANKVAENLNFNYSDEFNFHVTSNKPEDYLEDTYSELHKELLETVYKSIMGAIDAADEQMSKDKPYLKVVK